MGAGRGWGCVLCRRRSEARLFFFFQAEDGIRDIGVTGVQTCALPILIWRVVRTPTIAANPHRITSVSAAEPPASRQRIGSRLYAEDVACAADRMEEPR